MRLALRFEDDRERLEYIDAKDRLRRQAEQRAEGELERSTKVQP